MKKSKLAIVFLVSLTIGLPVFAKAKVKAEAPETESEENKTESVVDEPVDSEEVQNSESIKKLNPSETKKNYTGWVDTSGKDIDVKLGMVNLKARPKLGTFNIQAINEDGKSIPLLQTGNEYTTTSFYLRYNKKIYRLSAENSIQSSAKRLKDGLELTYRIPNVADVVVTFTCLESEPGSGYDMVKVDAVAVNKGNKKAAISQKLVLDTILGETDSSHFYTSENVPITNEVIYRTMQNENWFLSKNKAAALQLLLNGADISPIDAVALANYSTLQKNTWEPEMLSYRAFDTVTSYNNSAVGIFWPEKTVGVEEKTSSTFYISLSTDNNLPQGYAYIQKKDSIKPKAIPEVVIPEAVVENGPVQEVVQIPGIEEKPVGKTETVVIDAPVKQIPNVKFDVSSLTKEQLTPEYIQNLLDRILVLEESDVILNREELLQLNAELDAILESLR